MKKVLAIVCIVIFSLMVLGIPRSFQQSPTPPGDYAALSGRLAAAVMLVCFLFFSVRWHLTLSGHTYKVNGQAWASIFLGYSFIGILVGILMVRLYPAFGVVMFAVWILIGLLCWKWRRKVRATERGLSSAAPTPITSV